MTNVTNPLSIGSERNVTDILTKPGIKQQFSRDTATFRFPEGLSPQEEGTLKVIFGDQNIAILSFVSDGRPDYTVTFRAAALPILREKLSPYYSAEERGEFAGLASLFAIELSEADSHLKIDEAGLFQMDRNGNYVPASTSGILTTPVYVGLQLDENGNAEMALRRLENLCKNSNKIMQKNIGEQGNGAKPSTFRVLGQGNKMYVDITPLLGHAKAGIELINDLNAIESRRAFGHTLGLIASSAIVAKGLSMSSDAITPEADSASKKSPAIRNSEAVGGVALTVGGTFFGLCHLGGLAKPLNNYLARQSPAERECFKHFMDNVVTQVGIKPERAQAR